MKAPHSHAAKRQIFVKITEMRQLPIKHPSKVRSLGKQIAHAIIAMVEQRLDRIGHIVFKPFQPQRDDRPVAAGCFKLLAEVGNPRAIIKRRDLRW